MNRVGLIGNFSCREIGGQTLKTIEIKNAIQERYGICPTLDAYEMIRNPFSFVKKLSIFMKDCENIVVILSERGYFLLQPLLLRMNRKYNRKIIESVVGGRRQEWLSKHKMFVQFEKKVDLIYVEASHMVNEYRKMGLEQAFYQPNFRKMKVILSEEIEQRSENRPVRFCFMSRVIKKKGIETAAAMLREIREKFGDDQFSLHIYGPIDSGYKERFEQLLKEDYYLKYGGCIDKENTIEVLKEYDIFLFPTEYIGEGFPGVFLDAMAAGNVLICSDHNKSFVDAITYGDNGYLLPVTEMERWVDEIIELIRDRKRLKRMQKNSANRANEYQTDVVLKGFFEFCDRDCEKQGLL